MLKILKLKTSSTPLSCGYEIYRDSTPVKNFIQGKHKFWAPALLQGVA